jgi:hypothetical protein
MLSLRCVALIYYRCTTTTNKRSACRSLVHNNSVRKLQQQVRFDVLSAHSAARDRDVFPAGVCVAVGADEQSAAGRGESVVSGTLARRLVLVDAHLWRRSTLVSSRIRFVDVNSRQCRKSLDHVSFCFFAGTGVDVAAYFIGLLLLIARLFLTHIGLSTRQASCAFAADIGGCGRVSVCVRRSAYAVVSEYMMTNDGRTVVLGGRLVGALSAVGWRVRYVERPRVFRVDRHQTRTEPARRRHTAADLHDVLGRQSDTAAAQTERLARRPSLLSCTYLIVRCVNSNTILVEFCIVSSIHARIVLFDRGSRLSNGVKSNVVEFYVLKVDFEF